MPYVTSADPRAPDLSLTVIICAYTMDRWDDLTAAVGSLRSQAHAVDEVVLVVDHCPPLAERAEAELPDARIVPSRGRPGLSGARNTGIAEAHGDILAFLDDDAAADPQWTASLLADYRDGRVLGVGGLIRPRWDRRRPAWFPAEFDWVIGCTYRGMPQDRAPVRNMLGANMSFRRDVLAACGGFRADLGRVGTRPLGCEETELCIRASRQNPDGILLYEPAAAVRHHVPEQRATWRYFRARCYAEGLSKAAMARRTGTRQGLATERSYLRSTIPSALADALTGTWRHDGNRPSLATVPAVVAGVAVTAAGYAAGRLRALPRRRRTADEPVLPDSASAAGSRSDSRPEAHADADGLVMLDRSSATGPRSDSRPEPPTHLPDLYADVPELLRRLTDAEARGDALDAYLAACGIDQVVEDRLRGTASLARRLADHLGSADGGLPGRVALRCLDLATALGARRPAHRTLEAWHKGVRTLTTTLADALLATPGRAPQAGQEQPNGHVHAALTAVGSTVPDRALASHATPSHPPQADVGGSVRAALTAVGSNVPDQALPLLEDCLLRPPACFRDFDQHPHDVEELIARFAARYPDRGRPLLILGLRTSGSYLAPLAGVSARARGYGSVTVRTIRPGERLLPGEASTLRRIRRAGGLVLVLDDPPSSGRSLARVAREAERAGFAHERVVVVFATFGDGTVPNALTGRPCVVLPGTDWHIRRQLSADALRRTVTDVLPADMPVLAISSEPPGPPTRLGHLAVPLTVHVVVGERGETDVPMLAEGVGLGYLGRHAAAVADALAGKVPHVFGFADGLVLRDRGEPGRPSTPSDVPPDTIVDYVTARQRALRVPTDRSLLIDGQEPVWEIGARLLAGTLGRLGTPLRPFLIDPILRELLRSDRPSVVDGRMLPWLWSGDSAGGWHKTDFDEGCFSHLDLASADAVYDLAGAAVFAPEAEDRLVSRYQEITGDRIAPARWCVYKLVHAWNVRRLQRIGLGVELAAVDPIRTQDRAVQQLLGGLFLGDLDQEPRGPWCVLDIDGVLEADVLGFPMSSPAGALALRALRAHGYRVLLATGRPLPDVRDRCAAYRLPGGVAEYGAVIYDAASGESTALQPEHDGTLAARVRALPSTDVDPRYRCCVRAFRRTGHGRTALSPDTVRDVLTERSGPRRFTAIDGDAQTDFLPTGLNKIQGVRALTGLLDRADVPVALAVGDTHADTAVLRAARLGFAPGNARRRAMRAEGVEVLTRSYQAGLAQAVGRLLGHQPGGCPTCRAPALPAAEQALLALLAVPEGGRRGAAPALLRLALARPPAQSGSSRRTARTNGWSR